MIMLGIRVLGVHFWCHGFVVIVSVAYVSPQIINGMYLAFGGAGLRLVVMSM